MYYRDKYFAIDNVLQITRDSLVSCMRVVKPVNIEVRTHCVLNWDAFILDWDSGFFIR